MREGTKVSRSLLIICGFASAYAGNFVSSIWNLANDLKKKDESLSIFFAFPAGARKRFWVDDCRKISSNIFFYNETNRKSKIKSWRKIGREAKPNIVYSHFESPLLIRLGLSFCGVHRFVFHIHSDWSGAKFSVKAWARYWLNSVFNSFHAHFISVSQRKPIVFQRKTTFIPNAICKHRLTPANSPDPVLSAPVGAIRLLHFAWAPHIKGLDIALSAFKELDTQFHLRFKLFVVAPPTPEVISCLDSFGPKSSSVELIPPTPNVFSYFAQTDIFISSSRSEGYSYSVAEALCAGKKVVVSSIPGTQWAQRYPNVFVFKTENVDSLFETIIKAANANRVNVSPSFEDHFNFSSWENRVTQALFL